MIDCKFEVERGLLQDLFCEWLYNNGFDGYGYYENRDHENVTDRGGFENETFLINPFYWGEDEDIQDEPNFVFKPLDLKIEWYKYPFRSAYSNKELDYNTLENILDICKESLNKRIIKYTLTSQSLGNKIYYDSSEECWRYCEDNIKLDNSKKCVLCGKNSTNKGHDDCIKDLPCVSYACCGHGNIENCYTTLLDGTTIRGEDSVKLQKILNKYKIN